MTDNLVEIRNLRLNFITYEGTVKVLDGIDLDIIKGESLGLVGETGCGKSVTALSIMRLLPPNAEIVSGEIIFKDEVDILMLDEEDLRRIRGKEISMIFQEPMRALHPTLTAGMQIAENIILHRSEELVHDVLKMLDSREDSPSFVSNIQVRTLRKFHDVVLKKSDSRILKIIDRVPILKGYKKLIQEEARKKSVEMLKKVLIADPEKVAEQYPFELSGGMMQRTLIAMAISCNPTLLIADEPTTALDVTTQAKILDLIGLLKEQINMSMLYITHDLGVIWELCDRVAVMYAGTIVELSDTRTIFKKPLHPYTRGLLDAVPVIGRDEELRSIPGFIPNFLSPPSGCRFHPRCGQMERRCQEEKPKLLEIEEGHFVACHLYS